jgi:hypothetical protein
MISSVALSVTVTDIFIMSTAHSEINEIVVEIPLRHVHRVSNLLFRLLSCWMLLYVSITGFLSRRSRARSRARSSLWTGITIARPEICLEKADSPSLLVDTFLFVETIVYLNNYIRHTILQTGTRRGTARLESYVRTP